MLSEILDSLSAPRKLAWSALGLPESGSEILSQYLGMDPESIGTQLLGAGLESVGDPLTYLLPAGAGLTAKFLPKAARAVTSPASRAIASGLAKGEEGYFDINRVAKLLGISPSEIIHSPNTAESIGALDDILRSPKFSQFSAASHPDLAKIVDAYQEGSGKFNRLLQQGGSLESSLPEIQSLQSAALQSKIPENMMVYRGSGGLGKYRASDLEKMVGETIPSSGFVSTSYEPYHSFYGSPGRDVGQLDIFLPKGSSALNATSLVPSSTEQEILLPHGSLFKVLDYMNANRYPTRKTPGVLLKYLG